MSAALALSACAGLDTRLPPIDLPQLSAERDYQQKLAFAEMDALQSRLMRVADRVRVANADLCPKSRPGIGLKTHTLSNYPKTLREAAARELGATDTPTVLTVTEGSPAERAGIRQGDTVLVEGRAVKHSSDAFADALRTGALTLRDVDGRIREVGVEPRAECAYDVRLRMSSDINAFATGRSMTVTSGMLKFTESDDELAFILGHELAHNTMGHVRKIVTNYILSLGGTRYARPFELEADYVGLYYLARAGYGMEGVEDVWRRLALVSPRSTARAKTHPTSSERFLRIAAAREEIADKEAEGTPLIPNFVAGDS